MATKKEEGNQDSPGSFLLEGIQKSGTKVKGGTRVNNCVKIKK